SAARYYAFDDISNQASFPIPHIVWLRFGQGRYKMKVRQALLKASQFVNLKQITSRTGTIEIGHRTRVVSFGHIAQERENRCHSGTASNEDGFALRVTQVEVAIRALKREPG